MLSILRATTVAEFLDGTPHFRTDLYASRGTLMTHAESIQLFKKLDVKMTPELKFSTVQMPFDGFTQEYLCLPRTAGRDRSAI